jgi:uncharacterized protein (UPF0216 family)
MTEKDRLNQIVDSIIRAINELPDSRRSLRAQR